MNQSRNLAARMGYWSAHHRKTAIFGWLAFCIVAFGVGSMLGTDKLTASNAGVRELVGFDRLVDREFETPATERVIIQSQTLTVGDAAFKDVVTDVIARLRTSPEVTNITSPLVDSLVSCDQRSVLIDFEMKGDPETADDRVQPILDTTAAAQAAHPDFLIEEFGSASADLQLGKSSPTT